MKTKINIRKEMDLNELPETHPIPISESLVSFGIFLFQKKPKGYTLMRLYRDGTLSFLARLGFAKLFENDTNYSFIRNIGNVLELSDPVIMKETVWDFISDYYEEIEFSWEGESIQASGEELREKFLNQQHIIFNNSFLENLPTLSKPILKDDPETAYFAFKNGLVTVTKSGLALNDYDQLKDKCIWKDQIIDAVFKDCTDFNDCHYAVFTNNICNKEEDRLMALKTAIGYLLHNYNNPSKGQAVIFYDEKIKDMNNPSGGTGKGIVVQAVNQMRCTVKIDGKKFNGNSNFCFQQVNESTQVIVIDDVKNDFDFDRLNSVLTDGMNIEVKYRNEIHIPPENSPKIVITSNTIIENGGSTRKRRQFPIEFGDHYSSKIKSGIEEPIISEHGCVFFSEDWKPEEWRKFYRFMLECSMLYLKYGLVPYTFKSIEDNRLRQVLSEEFYDWILEADLKTNQEYKTPELLSDFKQLYNLGDEFKQRQFSNQLRKYANAKGIDITFQSSNGNSFFKLTQKS